MIKSSKPSLRLKADGLLMIVSIIWGMGFITQGIAAEHHLAYLFNGICFILASIILVPFLPRNQKVSPLQWRWMFIAGSILFGATALQQVGIYFTKIANAGFLTSLYIVFTPFLLWIIFKERPHRIDILAGLGATLGAFFLSTAGEYQSQAGDILEILGAVLWALHFVVLGKVASEYEPISFAAGHFLICGLFNITLGIIYEPVSQVMNTSMLLAIGFRAFASIGIGYTLQVWGQKHTPPTDAALILGLEAVFAALAGWWLLRQFLLPVQIAGCVIIFFSVLLSQFKNYRKTSHNE